MTLAATVLSGCMADLPVAKSKSPQHRVTVLGGKLTLAAPTGYCIDPKSQRDAPEAAFVLWGNCAAIARDPQATQPRHRALLSAAVGPMPKVPTQVALEGYERFFRSEAGRAGMARSGRAEDLKILRVQQSEKLLFLKIADRSVDTSGPVDGTYWRAITGISGHVAALSVMPLRGSGLDDATQRKLLQSLEASIRAAN
ncbi:hypothetical protein CKO11_14515 [Rhodobacter sp. TJ_12]|nr:hypothetical protein [Rhodobacter sp. TJ_12]